jgi:3-oxoadipate enol-lactonase
MSQIVANGLNLWCETRGDGPPLLIISGTGGDLRRKPGLLDGPLSRHFSCASYDQRGLGQSDKPDGPYTMADYADDAAAVLDALGWDTAHVMGVSFGGMVALNLAVRHPHRIRKLVLCCTSPGGEGGASYPLHELIDWSPQSRARHMIGISDLRRDEAWATANSEAFEALVAMASDDPWADEIDRKKGADLQLLARKNHNVWKELPSLTMPTLICGGLHDGMAPVITQRRMAERMPNARLSLFEGGHLFLIEDRKAYGEVLAFLQDDGM